jgi:hypothetical protein
MQSRGSGALRLADQQSITVDLTEGTVVTVITGLAVDWFRTLDVGPRSTRPQANRRV